MTNLQELLHNLIAEYTALYDKLTQGLQRTSYYKDMRLTCEVRNDSRFYRIVDPKQDNGRQQYRGGFFTSKEVQGTAASHYYAKARAEVSSMLKGLEQLQKLAVDIDPNFYPDTMPTAYQLQPPFVYDQMGVIDINAWQSKPRKYSEKNPEARKYRTRDGWMVRSKSEVLCADGYADAGIPYVYEALRKVAGRWMAPDFEALCIRRYMEILHEHCGKMDEPDYVMGSFVPRLSLYLQAGYTIGVDLFFTFETKQTPLTPQAVATTLAQYF